MTNDTLIKVSVFSAIYEDEQSAKNDYYEVKNSYESHNALDDFNAAVAFKNSANKIEIIVKNEYSTRQQTWLGMLIGFTIAVFTIIFVALLIPGYFNITEAYQQHYGPLKVILATISGGLIGAVIGHLQSGIGRSDLKDLAKVLNPNEYGLMVVSFGEMSEEVQKLIPTKNQVTQTEFKTTKKKLVQKIKKSFFH